MNYKIGDKVWLGNYTCGTLVALDARRNRAEIVSPVLSSWGTPRHLIGCADWLKPATQEDFDRVIP